MTTFKSNSVIGPKIKMLNTLVEKELNNTLANLDNPLTGTQITVLMTINDAHEQIITQKKMEEALKLSHPTTRGIVKRLVAMNLISTSKLADDQRQVTLHMTNLGTQIIEKNRTKINESVKNVESKITTSLSQEEQKQFLEMLTKIISNF